VKKATLFFNNIKLKHSQIHKFRGFVGNLFKEHNLIHNHDQITGKSIYRYPLIQFKIIDNNPSIVAITDSAINVFSEIFMKLNEIDIEGVRIPVYEKDLKVEEALFGDSEKKLKYEFASPWVALNQENYKKYQSTENHQKREEILQRSLAGNILSMSKYLDYTVKNRLEIDLKLKPATINLKGKSMIGFMGMFDVNFLIPDYMGIGKSVSRGFGTTLKFD